MSMIQAFDDLARQHAAEMAEAEADYEELSAERNALQSALAAVLPYAESRAEDMHESGGDDCPQWAKASAAVEAGRILTAPERAHMERLIAASLDTQSQADPWHLFRIEASDADGMHGFIASAQSASEGKAQELAENAALDAIGTDERPGEIEGCEYLGTCSCDVFEKFGPM
jgi:hypothetical protein